MSLPPIKMPAGGVAAPDGTITRAGHHYLAQLEKVVEAINDLPAVPTDLASNESVTAAIATATTAAEAARFRFHVHLSADQSGIANGTFTQVLFDTVDFDTGGFYDPVLAKWSPPAGYYHFTAQLTYSTSLVANNLYRSVIYKNGVALANTTLQPSVNGLFSPIASFDDLAADGDYYSVFAWGGGSGTRTISSDPTGSYFSAFSI